jgi:hypothetical protein
MAGSIKWQEGAPITIGTTISALTAGSGVLVGQLDCRSSGTAGAQDAFTARFALAAAWATVPAGAGTTMADLYLVPSIDGGVTFPDVDLTTGAAYIVFLHRFEAFVASKAPTANQTANFATRSGDLGPDVYNVYLINRSLQTISAGAVLKVQASTGQYT